MPAPSSTEWWPSLRQAARPRGQPARAAAKQPFADGQRFLLLSGQADGQRPPPLKATPARLPVRAAQIAAAECVTATSTLADPTAAVHPLGKSSCLARQSNPG